MYTFFKVAFKGTISIILVILRAKMAMHNFFIASLIKKCASHFFRQQKKNILKKQKHRNRIHTYWYTRAAVVHLNFRAGSIFPVPVCIVPSSMDRTSLCNKVDAVRLYASYRLNLLLPKGQICVFKAYKETVVYRTLLSLHEGSFEITLIVPLKGVFVKMKRLKKLSLATNSDF